MGELIGLKCQPEALSALASRLARYGPADGEPEWLVAAVWLLAGDTPYIASATVEVLSDGYLARPLNLHTPEQFSAGIEAELPNVAGRFAGRNHGIELPSTVGVPAAPALLSQWPEGPYATHVLVRVAERATAVHRIACALLFVSAGGASLLVGTDRSTLAMVVSEDDEVIERYRSDCEAMSASDYLARFCA
ncbi:MAG: hypothetical protein ACM3ZV_05885 [Bacillota bacterium]